MDPTIARVLARSPASTSSRRCPTTRSPSSPSSSRRAPPPPAPSSMEAGAVGRELYALVERHRRGAHQRTGGRPASSRAPCSASWRSSTRLPGAPRSPPSRRVELLCVPGRRARARRPPAHRDGRDRPGAGAPPTGGGSEPAAPPDDRTDAHERLDARQRVGDQLGVETDRAAAEHDDDGAAAVAEPAHLRALRHLPRRGRELDAADLDGADGDDGDAAELLRCRRSATHRRLRPSTSTGPRDARRRDGVVLPARSSPSSGSHHPSTGQWKRW